MDDGLLREWMIYKILGFYGEVIKFETFTVEDL
jgi:hypothetical protein